MPRHSVSGSGGMIVLLVAFGCARSASAGEKSIGPAAASPMEKLPAGLVRGDVVSYSYVPNRQWGRAEACGILPYLFEYALMKCEDGWDPLEKWHAENIRRIDMASQWSTAITLSVRYERYTDEIINLMVRCFRNRQLIILGAEEDANDSHRVFRGLLSKLWQRRDQPIISPEGDGATGRQLINNILAYHIGDEELGSIKTAGLEQRIRTFRDRVQDWRVDGERPFAHIKTWFNEIHYGLGSYAASQEDLAKGRQRWPANAEFIGVDVYHFWDFTHTPFDPDDPSVPRRRVAEHAIAWQNVVTKYYGPGFRVVTGDRWDPKNKNDTHAMMQGIDLAGADRAMMIFIANSCNVRGTSYTTPIETMDAFYDSLKAGPWVGVSWWIFGGYKESTATLDYPDGTLKRYTPGHPEGIDYGKSELENYRHRFVASRKRMFNDVVYGQFRYLNGPKPAPATQAKEQHDVAR
jgi:hypothetical protein